MEIICKLTMGGTKSYALRLEIHFLAALTLKKMETNTDVLMNYTPTKCGAPQTSEEWLLHRDVDRIWMIRSMIKNGLTELLKKNKPSKEADGFNGQTDPF